MKLFMVSESNSGYIWNFYVYSGQTSTVVNLTKNLLGSLSQSEQTIYTDWFYTSPTLGKELEREDIALFGTTIKNRKGMPHYLKQGKLQQGLKICRHNGNCLAFHWKHKRDVYMNLKDKELKW